MVDGADDRPRSHGSRLPPSHSGSAKRHHLVSRGYQAAWSDDGRRIVLVTKATSEAKVVGLKSAFVARHLLTFRTAAGASDALEVEFGKVESRCIPQLQRFIQGARDEAAERAVRAITALHWARGLSTIETQRRIASETREEWVARVENDDGLRRAFVADRGRLPVPGEMEQLLEEQFDLWDRWNGFFVERVQVHYNTALSHLQTLGSQRFECARPSRAEFVFADSPVVVTDGLRGTARRPVGLYEATSIWFPLSPSVGVALTRVPHAPAEVRLPPIGVQERNLLSWRFAAERLGARPGSDLDRAFGNRQGTFALR